MPEVRGNEEKSEKKCLKKIDNKTVIQRPEHVSVVAGNSSRSSVGLGHAVERMLLFQAPRGKYSGLLASQSINKCILFCIKSWKCNSNTWDFWIRKIHRTYCPQ